MSLKCPNSCSLVIVTDGDQLISVSSTPSHLSHHLSKLTKLLANVTERLGVQVQERYAEIVGQLKLKTSNLYKEKHFHKQYYANNYLYSPYISQSISLGVAGERNKYLPNSSDISDNGKLFRQFRQFSAASFFLNLTNT